MHMFICLVLGSLESAEKQESHGVCWLYCRGVMDHVHHVFSCFCLEYKSHVVGFFQRQITEFRFQVLNTLIKENELHCSIFAHPSFA